MARSRSSELLAAILGCAGYRVPVAADACQAATLLRRHSDCTDLLVSDLGLAEQLQAIRPRSAPAETVFAAPVAGPGCRDAEGGLGGRVAREDCLRDSGGLQERRKPRGKCGCGLPAAVCDGRGARHSGRKFPDVFAFLFPAGALATKTKFKIGYPTDFGFGVDTKFQSSHRIWVVRNTEGVFVIVAICTHLGCTPDWKPAENKFKCPCHGSGYDAEGINFEGPAPRPMDRAHVELDPEGEIVVDTSHLYSWPKGERSQFNDPGAILHV